MNAADAVTKFFQQTLVHVFKESKRMLIIALLWQLFSLYLFWPYKAIIRYWYFKNGDKIMYSTVFINTSASRWPCKTETCCTVRHKINVTVKLWLMVFELSFYILCHNGMCRPKLLALFLCWIIAHYSCVWHVLDFKFDWAADCPDWGISRFFLLQQINTRIMLSFGWFLPNF